MEREGGGYLMYICDDTRQTAHMRTQVYLADSQPPGLVV